MSENREGSRDDLTERKRALRRSAAEARLIARDAMGETTANRILHDHVVAQDPGVVSAYMAIRSELDPMPTMMRLFDAGVRVCVPVIVATGQPLEFHEWTATTTMVRGDFGARIPERAQVLVPDVVITPLLAFDSMGHRLGYGGGFYDRTFARIRSRQAVHGVGFAYSAQEVPEVPVDATDVPLDAIVTERGVVRPSGQ